MSVILKASDLTFVAPLVSTAEFGAADTIQALQLHALIAQSDPFRAAATMARIRWEIQARTKQIPPDDLVAWATWLILSGRGWGKTQVGASISGLFALENENVRVGIIAPTAADVRDTCLEGISGILNFIPPICFKGGSRESGYNRSYGEIDLANGSKIKGFAATEPDRLRGPQHHFIWGDESAAWKYLEEVLDNMRFGLRLGDDPKELFTTTPRPLKLLREMRDHKDTRVTVGSTMENSDNLSDRAVKRLVERYDGTRIGRQELHGEILEDTPGALWTQKRINQTRITEDEYRHIEIVRVVVGVDPAASANGAETGIVTCAADRANHGFVLADDSVRGRPEEWAAAAVRAYYTNSADCIVAEVNNGGDMVESVIRAVDSNVPVKKVHASRGKAARAEPISTMAEQGKWHHVGSHQRFFALEEQMCRFVPGEIEKEDSPDRVDAHVWAGHELFFAKDDIKVVVRDM